jgi:ribosomal-protein-alanine N-acetyltransferase
MTLSDSVYVFGVFRKEDGAHIGKIDISTLIRVDIKWEYLVEGVAVHGNL